MLRHFSYVDRHISDQSFGTPASATTLQLHGQAHFDQCFGTPASAMTLLLRGKAHSDQCFGTPASATTLLLRGQVHSDRCFSTPASATTLLLCGQALSDQCFGTPVVWYDTSVLYSTFGYLLCCVLLISYYWSRYSNRYMIRV